VATKRAANDITFVAGVFADSGCDDATQMFDLLMGDAEVACYPLAMAANGVVARAFGGAGYIIHMFSEASCLFGVGDYLMEESFVCIAVDEAVKAISITEL
jgi:hypothetical protein